jgi:mutator protein MutT
MTLDSSPSHDVIVVIAGVIERGGRLLVTRRTRGQHLEGLWEFPGGKLEPHETVEACLRREMREELGVDCTVGHEILMTSHTYPERTVRLHFLACAIHGAPQARLGQEMRWVTRDELGRLEFPEADADLVRLLSRQA